LSTDATVPFIPVPELEVPRDSVTAQAVILTNMETPIPLIYVIKDLGDAGKDGKFSANAIPGGRAEVFFSITIDDESRNGFIERDLLVRGFKPVELNGITLTEKRGLSYVLRRYPLGSTLLLKGIRDEKIEESYLITTERDETADEAVLRETRMETGLLCEIVPSEEVYYPLEDRLEKNDEIGMFEKRRRIETSEYGEVLHEVTSDFVTDDKGGKPAKKSRHHVYVFHLRFIKKIEGIAEIDEVSMISEIRLSLFMRKIFCEPLASRDNPEGFFYKHGLRVMNTLWMIGFDHIPFMPKDSLEYSWELKPAYREFLPDDAFKALCGAVVSDSEDTEEAPASATASVLAVAGRDDSAAAWEKFLGIPSEVRASR